MKQKLRKSDAMLDFPGNTDSNGVILRVFAHRSAVDVSLVYIHVVSSYCFSP